MKDDFITKNRGYLYLAFFVIALITFFPLFFTGFATADDFHYYLVTRNSRIMSDSSMFAQLAGRFYFYIVMPVYSLPYIVDNMAVVKLFQFIPLIVCFLLFARIIFMSTKSKEMSWIFLLISLMTMQISRHTSLFVAYPFYFTFSFSMLLVSFILLLQYFEARKKALLIWAALFFAVGLLFYETYILFLFFAGVTILYYNIKDRNSTWDIVKKSAVQFLPFLLIGIIYITAYFIFRVYYPSQYAGTNFGTKEITLVTFFQVIWKLSVSAFPMTIYETTHNLFHDKSELVNGYSPVLLNLFLSAQVEWIVKGILVSFIGYKLLLALPVLKFKWLLVSALMSVLLVFMPHIPLALTEKYTFYALHGNMLGYVTTFFSSFGAMLLIILLLNFLINLFNFNRLLKQTLTVLFVFGFFLCSLLTDFSNHAVAKDIRSANLRFNAIDELLKTDEFKSVPVGSPFYGRDLWDNPSYSAASLTEQGFNWFEYFEAKTGKVYPVGREDTIFLAYSKRVPQVPWYIAMRQAEKSEDISLVLARMAPLQPLDSVVNHFADRATVLYYSPYKIFTLIFRVKQDVAGTNIPIRVNHIAADVPCEKTVEITIYNTKKSQPATIFTLQIPGIDLNSVMISNMINRGNRCFYL